MQAKTNRFQAIFFGALTIGLGVSACFAGAVYDGSNTITVAGSGNTLQTIAAATGNPAVFAYNPENATAVCQARLVIDDGAILTIGSPDDPAKKETLKMNVVKRMSEDLIITVKGKGRLALYHSEITADPEYCYKIFSHGEWVMKNAKISRGLLLLGRYQPGNNSLTIRNSTIELMSGWAGLVFHGPSKVEIEGLTLDGKAGGAYGINHIESASMRLKNMIMEKVEHPLELQYNSQAAVVLVDPQIDRDKIEFKAVGAGETLIQPTASVIIQRSLFIRILNAGGQPLAGAKVLASTEGITLAESAADKNGECHLEVPQCKINNLDGGANEVTTYQWELRIDDGQGYQTVRTKWTPAGRSAFQYIKKAEGPGYSESEIEYKEAESRQPETVNLIRNNSFEITANASTPEYPGIPDCWAAAWQAGSWSGRPVPEGTRYGVDEAVAWHGRRSLKISFPTANQYRGKYRRQDIRMVEMPVEPNTTYTFSIYLKSDRENFRVRLNRPVSADEKFFQVGTTWQRYAVATKIAWETKIYLSVSVFGEDLEGKGGTLWLDGAQFEKGAEPTPYAVALMDLDLKPKTVAAGAELKDAGAADEILRLGLWRTALAEVSGAFRKLKKKSAGSAATRTSIGRSRELLVDGAPVFPVFCYGIQEDNMEAAIKNGNNCTLISESVWPMGGAPDLPAARAYLDAAQAKGLGVFVRLNTSYYKTWWHQLRETKEELEAQQKDIEAVVGALKDHPAVWGWYIADEPDLSMGVPSRVEKVYAFVKRADPGHIAWLVNYYAAGAQTFFNATDVVSLDPYPIPRGSIAQVARDTKAARQLNGEQKPAWIILQAFGGSEVFDREPTPREERCMAYLALANGARGLGYFDYKPAYGPLWRELEKINREIKILAPVLLAPETEQTVALSPKTAVIHVLQKKYAGKTYLLAVNPMDSPVTVEFCLPESGPLSRIKVLFENRTIKGKANGFTDSFPGYARHVYEIAA